MGQLKSEMENFNILWQARMLQKYMFLNRKPNADSAKQSKFGS
jgi:hypothetical protein